MHFYLFQIQYLGFRYHGWAKQKDVKTVHRAVDKTLSFVLSHSNFKTLGSSRTDALVSANQYFLELFIEDEIEKESFLPYFNSCLPADIRLLDIQETDKHFNIIRSSKLKEYNYLFAFGEKFHPFCAAIMAYFPYKLNIELMKQAAELFVGKHNFRNYCTKPSENGKFEREIICSEIIENELYTANFFPEHSFLYRVSSTGFMRNQVRLMMAQLVELGKGTISLQQLEDSLQTVNKTRFREIAPASGLILQSQEF